MDLAQGRYRIIRRLGEGGSGVVYSAADTLLGRTVAIKALHRAFDSAVLHHEARALAYLNHPCVVSIYDLIEQDGRPYLIMEHVDGCDLGQWLSERGPLPMDDALALFASIAAPVADAHQCGILHCDLKPSNVLLSTDGQVKLTDFTLARLLGVTDSIRSYGGSDGYAAPETLTGGEVDARTDVFGLGALLHRLTGSSLGADPTSTQIRATIARARSAAPDDRFATVEAMISALPLPAEGVTRVAGRSIVREATRILPRPAPRKPSTAVKVVGPIFTGLAALVVAVAGIFVRLPAAASPARVTLPNLVAAQSGSAQLVARSLQLHYRALYAYSPNVPAGVVMAQRPAPNTPVDRQGTVTVTVSKGPAPVAIPDVSGAEAESASAALTRLGFHVLRRTQDSLGTSAGLVLDQTPPPGTLRVPGSTVTLTISQKPWWDVFGW